MNLNFRRVYLRLTYDIWRRILPKYLGRNRSLTLLDCGCGPGELLSFLEKWFPKFALLGLDLASGAIDKARQRTCRTSYVRASAESLPFPGRSMDIIVSLHMVEHLKIPEQFLSEASRVLKPGGLLVLATPNPKGLGARVMKSRWASWCPEHISLLPPETWREFIKSSGLAILSDGTTGLSGIPIFHKLPLGLINWVPLFLCGYFSWGQGEAYLVIGRKGSANAA